jgi:hypothetical protein
LAITGLNRGSRTQTAANLSLTVHTVHHCQCAWRRNKRRPLTHSHTHTQIHFNTQRAYPRVSDCHYHGHCDCGPLSLPLLSPRRDTLREHCSETRAISFLVQCGARWTLGHTEQKVLVGPSSSPGIRDLSAFLGSSLLLSCAQRVTAWTGISRSAPSPDHA